jgi:hypothetical protein
VSASIDDADLAAQLTAAERALNAPRRPGAQAVAVAAACVAAAARGIRVRVSDDGTGASFDSDRAFSADGMDGALFLITGERAARRYTNAEARDEAERRYVELIAKRQSDPARAIEWLDLHSKRIVALNRARIERLMLGYLQARRLGGRFVRDECRGIERVLPFARIKT